jgi:hypothetical protein
MKDVSAGVNLHHEHIAATSGLSCQSVGKEND